MIFASVALYSGFINVASSPAGRRVKASLVGANSVNGPGPDSVVVRPAALIAPTSGVRLGAAAMFSAMVLVSTIATPPNVGLGLAAAAGAGWAAGVAWGAGLSCALAPEPLAHAPALRAEES